ncbi:MAG: hypothetical protein IT373_10460 [Polyangiaceae bacterium]|nr:hypothetical protein [Polyangiaceae bacterium]
MRSTLLGAAWLGWVAACSSDGAPRGHTAPTAAGTDGSAPATEAAAPARASTASASTTSASTASASTASATGSGALAPPPASPVRRIPFAWKPPKADDAPYAMADAEDQHHLVLGAGVERGGAYPVVVGLHGQPRRGEEPRAYAFPRTVEGVVAEMVERGELGPTVLVLPVFRYLGVDWPAFDLAELRTKVEALLAEHGVRATRYFVFGHSGAAGCGGDGLNRAERLGPAAVGFFDTCVGPGLVQAIGRLHEAAIPTLVLHSVETAGFVPRQKREYLASFDFGRAYRPLGLAPVTCPARLPDAPLRDQPYRCAADAAGVVRAFVVDTGDGEAAHEALVPVAVRYFLRELVATAARP